jgi:hypothetical protein
VFGKIYAMRFMFIIHTDSKEPPTPALMEAMHELAKDEVAAGRMVYDGGLMPASMAKQLELAKGKLRVLDGPFTETKEIIGGFAVFELPDMEAAVESARAFFELHRQHAPGWEGRCEIRQIAGSQVELLRAGKA